jgi:hypothetical protein
VEKLWRRKGRTTAALALFNNNQRKPHTESLRWRAHRMAPTPEISCLYPTPVSRGYVLYMCDYRSSTRDTWWYIHLSGTTSALPLACTIQRQGKTPD